MLKRRTGIRFPGWSSRGNSRKEGRRVQRVELGRPRTLERTMSSRGCYMSIAWSKVMYISSLVQNLH